MKRKIEPSCSVGACTAHRYGRSLESRSSSHNGMLSLLGSLFGNDANRDLVYVVVTLLSRAARKEAGGKKALNCDVGT